MSQEHSPATNGGEEYRVVFDETGGYDCMTGGFAIVRQNGDIAAEIDLRHYGQKPCDYEGSGFVDAKERAEFAAHLICAAINASNASPGCPPPSASCEPDPELTACARSAPRGDFIYLLNAFERASQSDNPSLLDYARKRQTPLDYVSKLETVPSETPQKPVAWRYKLKGSSMPWRLVESESDCNQLASYEREPLFASAPSAIRQKCEHVTCDDVNALISGRDLLQRIHDDLKIRAEFNDDESVVDLSSGIWRDLVNYLGAK